MISRTIAAIALLTASAFSYASPELLAPIEVHNIQLNAVETLIIDGDINDSLQQLVNNKLKDKSSDFYVIDEISEDTFNNTLTVVITLYNQHLSFLSEDLSLS
ncbi:hypothetical protein ACQKPX_21050 [Photobacterium sp. DNB23_23_1]|uniref:Uncharacterized protein n=1 Tax=Photobacterium pectinilyticum TaxID=2906793 RepID=A0ABT1N4T9_9GAMM|nr:hypothetical protein [Photobacterium sp. ZSDE20]MCQ1059749.1 hypothetical protein [Photobacterium sp. ZSDE20]MDD1825984.1 hypothetical protein [Photobacterium sp. ZSDE20]